MREIGIGARIAGALALVLLVAAAVLVAVMSAEFSGAIGTAEKRELLGYRRALDNALDRAGGEAGALATLTASLPDVRDAFVKRDRAKLTELLEPGFKALKGGGAVAQIQFHTPPAVSFLRLHKPEKFGDDLSSFRATVVRANQTGEPIIGLENGVGGLGFRAVVPMGGGIPGTLEYGADLGKAFVENFKSRFGVDAAIYEADDKGGWRTVASTAASVFDGAAPARALAGETLFVDADVGGHAAAGVMSAIADYSGKPVLVAEIVMDASDYAARAGAARIKISMAVLAAFLAVIGAGVIAIRGVTRPLRRLVEAVERLSRGDTAAPVADTERRDEIGPLARALESFRLHAIERAGMEATLVADRAARAARAERIEVLTRAFDTAAARAVGAAASAAEQLEATAGRMSGVAARTTDQARAVEEAGASAANDVNSVAAATDELSASIGEIGSRVEESARIARRAADDARDTDGIVENLSSSARRIGDVVALINTIAAQTNLLALNATIEAARAGDAGKGFAVVANEVKTLAGQTARATEEITGHIEGIQAQTTQAVSAIRDIARTIDAINQLSADISAAVEEQAAATGEIARSVRTAHEQTTRVSAVIGGVRDGADESGSAAREVMDAAVDLHRQAEALRVEVDGFLTNVRAA